MYGEVVQVPDKLLVELGAVDFVSVINQSDIQPKANGKPMLIFL